MMRRYQSLAVLVTLCAVATAPGCKKKNKETTATAAATGSQSSTTEAPPLVLNFKPSAEQLELADKIAQSVNAKRSRFESELLKDPQNAKLLLHLAADNDSAAVVASALNMMSALFSMTEAGKERPDEDFVNVVLANLGHDDPAVVARALQASRVAATFNKPNKKIIEAVLAKANEDNFKSGAGRYAIIETLMAFGPLLQGPSLQQAAELYTSSLDAAESQVVTLALQALLRNRKRLPDRPLIIKKSLALTQHQEQVVRGHALEFLGLVGKGDPKVEQAVLAGMKDQSPYVRSESCRAALRLQMRPAIHELIKLVDDKEKDTADLIGWLRLDGDNGRIRTHTTTWNAVRESAIYGIVGLSDGSLKIDSPPPKDPEGGLDQGSRTAKAWYAKEKAKLPALGSAAAAGTASPEPSAKRDAPAATTAPSPRSVPAPKPTAAP